MEMQLTACLHKLKGSQQESVDSQEPTEICLWIGAFTVSACTPVSCLYCVHVCLAFLSCLQDKLNECFHANTIQMLLIKNAHRLTGAYKMYQDCT